MECISFILGIVAWVIPFAAKGQEKISSAIFTGASFACCGIAVLLQFMTLHGFVLANDMAAIEDIIGMMTFAVAALIVGTIASNVYALYRRNAMNR